MPTFANRNNHSTSVPMSESDNDEDNEQNSSINQQNESMMHKVKDVVSKLLHPSFLFSSSGDMNRPKRKRETSSEENEDEQQSESASTTTVTSMTTTTNGHSAGSKANYHRQPITTDEPQLTDDEDNNRDVSPTERNSTEIEQQKKRRRTANFQHIISTTTTNGNHEDEKSSLSLTSTNSAGSLSNRRIINNGVNTVHTTPGLLQTNFEQKHNEGVNRLTSKQRFNIPSTNRGSVPSYDPSQSPLFSVGTRKTNEITMSPNRTTTNLKSNNNDFSANYLLATGLANRSQSTTSNSQQATDSTTARLASTERQVLGVNYASINSRRLPYIERLRRRTLQDCIRLNRTLDSEPLSISTIEEHTSTTTSPIRKQTKAPEKECGIQCNISTINDPIEPNKKSQRTFPPTAIRNEALSMPPTDKTQSTCQSEYSSIQTNSSITIEPIQPVNDVTKPKVLGNITPFSWPKFARAQEDYSKKNPEKCRADAIPSQPRKPIVLTATEKSTAKTIFSSVATTNVTSATSKAPIFGTSPPRSTKSMAGPVWKCPSCSMEHSAQIVSCSVCHGINPNYKRLTTSEATTTSISLNKVPEIIIEEPITTKSSNNIQLESVPVTTSSLSSISTTKENTLSVPTSSVTTTIFATTNSPSLFNVAPVTTKENFVIAPPVTTSSLSTSIPTTTTTTTATMPLSLFGASTAPASLDKQPTTSAPSSNLFQFGTTPTPAFPTAFGSFTSASTTTTSSAAVTTLTKTTTSSNQTSTTGSFGTFGGTSFATTTVPATTLSFTAFTERPTAFTHGTSSSAPLPPLSSTTTSISASTTVASSIAPPLFGFSAAAATPATTAPTTTAALVTPLLSGGFSSASTLFNPVTTTITSTTVPVFGSSLSTPGFSFQSAATTTTASNSTPFTFGANNTLNAFAPAATPSTNTTSAFGATSLTTTTDKGPSSIPSFSGFNSTTTPSPMFQFGAPSNTTSSSIQAANPPLAATGGFSFVPSTTTTTTTAPVFGSPAPPFSFGASPVFSFGAQSTPPTNNTPFQFSASPATTGNSSFSTPFPGSSSTPENNPFSVGEDGSAKRHVIKAKRRNKP